VRGCVSGFHFSISSEKETTRKWVFEAVWLPIWLLTSSSFCGTFKTKCRFSGRPRQDRQGSGLSKDHQLCKGPLRLTRLQVMATISAL